MTTRSELRDAFAQLAELAPRCSVTDMLAALESGPEPAGEPALQVAVLAPVAPPARPRRRPARWLAVAAAAAVMVTAVALISGIPAHRGTPSNPWPAGYPNNATTAPASGPGYPTDYVYGEGSLPKYWEAAASLRPSGQSVTLSGEAYGQVATVFVFSFARSSNLDTLIGALPVVRVGSVTMAHGVFGGTSQTGSDAALGAVVRPATKTSRSRETVFWQQVPGRWTAMSGELGNGVPGTGTGMPLAEITAMAAQLKPKKTAASMIKIGYVPAYLQLQSVSDSTGGKYGDIVERDNLPGNTLGGYGTLLSFVDRSVPAAQQSAFNPTVDVVFGYGSKLPDLAKVSVAQLRYRVWPGSWTRTQLGGHVAWIGAHGVLVQVGGQLLSVSTPGHSAGSPPPISVLTAMAASLSVKTGDHGAVLTVPLSRAVPAGALS